MDRWHGHELQLIGFLDSLRGLLIVLVIGVHAAAYAPLPEDWAGRMIGFVVATAAVKGFFLVDGFLFARSLQTNPLESGKSRLLRGAHRLLLPWLYFSAFYFILRVAGGRLGIQPMPALASGGSLPANALHALWYSETSAQMYFLVSLFALRALATTISHWLRGCSPWPLLFSSIAVALVFRMVIEPMALPRWPLMPSDPLFLALGGLPSFLLGAAAWGFRAHRLRGRTAWAAVLLSTSLLAGFSSARWAVATADLTMVSGLFLLFSGLPDGSPAALRLVGKRTMGIYLLHLPLALKIGSLVLVGRLGMQGLGAYLALVAATTVISLAAVLLAERLGLSRMLFGEGRGGRQVARAS